MKVFFSISILMTTLLCATTLFSQSDVNLSDENKPGNFVSKIFSPSDSLINNSKFLKTIAERRTSCELMITQLIASKRDSSVHKSNFEALRKSYNMILDRMDADIARMDNLAEFALSNTTEYQEDLKESEVLARKFLVEGSIQLGQDASFMSELFKEVIDLLPGVKQMHDLTLKVFKKRLRTKIKNSRFRKWEVVGMM
jgi:hypothetical protein